jgi:hypothetical protein
MAMHTWRVVVALRGELLSDEVQTVKEMHDVQTGYIDVLVMLLEFVVFRTPGGAGFVFGYWEISILLISKSFSLQRAYQGQA